MIKASLVQLALVFTLSFFEMQSAWALEFNQKELLILSGKQAALAEGEGYLYLPVLTNANWGKVYIDHVESGKQIKFKDVVADENHALLKLKSGKYYFRKIKKYIGYGSVTFKFDKDKYVFEVKEGVLNYPGNWFIDFEWLSRGRVSVELKLTNKFISENDHYQKQFSHILPGQQLTYSGSVPGCLFV